MGKQLQNKNLGYISKVWATYMYMRATSVITFGLELRVDAVVVVVVVIVVVKIRVAN